MWKGSKPMIKKLKIKDFQSHKDTEIEFHPGFNVITGPSDSGKSAIVRSCDLVINNRPSGWDYKSWGKDTKETSVSMEFDEGSVERKRSNTFNRYIVNNIEYTALGKGGVPSQVTDVTKMNKNNLQRQHDIYFMIQNTPGEVATMLNEVAGLEIIDKVTYNIESIVDKTKSNIEIQKENNAKSAESLKNLQWMEKAKTELTEFNTLVTELELFLSIRSNLHKSIVEYNLIKEELSIRSEFIESTNKPYQQILNLVREINTLVNEQSRIIVSITNYEHHKKLLIEKDKFLSSLPTYDLLCGKINDTIVLQKKYKTLEEFVRQYELLQDLHKQSKVQIESIEKKYKELLLSESICPVCGGGIDEETLSWFVGNL
jgi:DNA repair protein SbcC/Rad50